MDDTLRLMANIGVIPVIAIEDAGDAVPLADALKEGGLPAMEITFRTSAGEEALRRVAAERPEILLGAGTVLNLAQCERAVEAGARFVVSPGYDADIVAYCGERSVTVLPGCANASDLTRAVNAGLHVVKFFPAEQSGGIGFLKAVALVFPQLNFMPTGGINGGNLLDYLAFDRIIACGGTWMVKKELIENGRWETITQISRDAERQLLGLTIRGLTLSGGPKEAQTAQVLSEAFCRKPESCAALLRCAEGQGCLTIGTDHLERAIYHLELRGAAFDRASQTCDAAGRISGVSLIGEIGGLTVRLVRN